MELVKHLNILFIEDLPSDYELAKRHISNDGIKFNAVRVDNKADFFKQLKEFKPEIIISDYALPQFDGMQALKFSLEFNPFLPFILLTGSMNEATAVECMKAGATDYVIKEHIARLPLAVKSALEQRVIKEEKEAALKALKISEEKFRHLAEHALDVIFRISFIPNVHFEYVSPSSTKVIGFTPQEHYDESDFVKNHVHPEDLHFIKEIKENKDKRDHIKIFRWIHKDGTIRWLEHSLFYVHNENNELVAIEGINRDITSEKIAEEELINSKHFLNTLINSIPTPLFFKDTDGVYFLLNKAFLQIFGLNEMDVLGKTIHSLPINNENADRFHNLDIELIKNKNNKTFENEIVFNDGLVHNVIIHKATFVNTDGSPGGLIGVMSDISDRKKVEDNLRAKTEEIDNFFNNALDLLCIANTDGYFKRLNKEWENVLGYPIRQIEGARILDYVHFDDFDSTLNFITNLKEQKEVLNFVNRFRSKEGSYRYLEWKAFPSGKTIYASAHDITERLKSREELINAKEKAEVSDKLKTSFLANMSHEIRTPMNGIVGFSSLLSEPNFDDATKNQFTSIIQSCSKQLLTIIDDLIDIAKIEANQIAISKENINLNGIMSEIFSVLEKNAKESGLDFSFSNGLDAEHCIIVSDGSRLRQILYNLVSNAIKFTEKGFVKFGYRLDLNVLEFFVEDTGIGIPDANKENIFERFRQAQNTVYGKHGGTGLGLSISNALIGLLGGKIWLKSEINKGTVFYFTIPFTPVVQNPLPEVQNLHIETADSELSVPNFKKTILIAEDEINNFLYIQYVLSKLNLNLIHALDGLEAIEKVQTSTNIDLILMDIRMPIMDGFEATSKIKKIRPEIPVIAVTAFAKNSDREYALQIGCDDYISKPFQKEKLMEMVLKYIS